MPIECGDNLLTWSLLLAAMGFFTKSFDPSKNVDNWNRTPSMDCASLTACFKAPVSLLGMLTVIPSIDAEIING